MHSAQSSIIEAFPHITTDLLLLAASRRSRIVVVISGGIDSTVLLYLLRAMLPAAEIHAVFFDYGQLSARETLPLCERHCVTVKAKFLPLRITIPDFCFMGDDGIRREGYRPAADNICIGADVDWYYEKVWSYVQGRNLRFFTEAHSYAAAIRADAVYYGLQFDKDVWHLYDTGQTSGDGDPTFLAEFNRIAFSCFHPAVPALAPFFDTKSDKAEIVRLGVALGVDLALTYSCEFHPRCGACDQCVRAQNALTAANHLLR